MKKLLLLIPLLLLMAGKAHAQVNNNTVIPGQACPTIGLNATNTVTGFTFLCAQVNGVQQWVVQPKVGVLHASGAPTGFCFPGFLYTDDATGNLYACNSGVWALATGGNALTGQTAGQVPIANSANTANTSKAIQGTEVNLLSSDGTGITGQPYCRSTSGGVTTGNCLADGSPVCTTDTFTSTPTYTFDSIGTDQCHIMVLSGNVTSITIAGTPSGHSILRLKYPENGTGGFTVAFPGNFVFPTGFTFHTGSNNQNNMGWEFDSTASLWRPITDFGGGGGGGGSPAGNPNAIQIQSGGNFGASNNIFDNSTNFVINEDTQHQGPNPSVDIRAYGARYVSTNPTAASVSCTSGQPTVTVGTVTGTFIVGDYVFIPGCGATNTVATPSAPTIAASGSSRMQTVPDAQIIGQTGSSTYSYLLVTKDANGGLTLPSAAATTTTGVPIGQQTATVSSVTSAGQILTITLGSNGPPNGTLFHLSYVAQGAGQTNHKFDGYYNICSGGGTTSIQVCNMPFWSTTTDSTAAEIIWFQGNQLTWTNQTGAWTQYICGKRPGDVAFHFLGSAVPASGNGPAFTKWVDWGSVITINALGLPEGADAICTAASATNDYLDNVKINSCSPVGCGSGSTWTLSGNAGFTGTATGTTQQDSAPALTAANNANVNSGVALTIPCAPSTSFAMNFYSPQALTSQRNWIDDCSSNLNILETIDLGNVVATYSIPWIGRVPSMLNANPQNINGFAYPVLNNTGIIRNINFNDQTAQGIEVLENTNQVSNGNQTIMMDHNQFQGGVSTIGIFAIGVFPFGYLTNTKWLLGPSNAPSNYDATWMPALYLDGGTELYYRNSYGFGRGTYLNNNTTNSPGVIEFSQYYVQGSIMPMIGVWGQPSTNTSITILNLISDTSPQSVVDFQTNPASPAANFIYRARDITGLPVNALSGWSPTFDFDEFNYAGGSGFQVPSAIFPDVSTNFGRLALQTGTRNDNFNRGSLGSNWVNVLNSISISGNQIVGTANAWNIAYDLGSAPLPNFLSQAVSGQFCDVTIAAYGSSRSGCSLLGNSTTSTVTCTSSGTQIFLEIPNSSILAGGTNYSGGGPGDRLYATATFIPGQANVNYTCTVYPVNGPPVSNSASNAYTFSSNAYPGIATFGNTGGALNVGGILDNFSGGTINPIVYPTVENAYQAPQHFLSATVGSSTPIPGTLPVGYLSAGSVQSLGFSAANGLNAAYDGFNRAGPGLGANWTTFATQTNPTIASNQVVSQVSGSQNAGYTATSFSADQFSEVTLPVGGNSATSGVDVICRSTPSTTTGYGFRFLNGAYSIWRFLGAGTFTTIAGPTAGTLLTNDMMRIECQGTTITGYNISAGVKTQIIQVSDGNITSGSPGIGVFGTAAQATEDNWNGGNLNPMVQTVTEYDFLAPQHIYSAMTVGNTAPIAGALPFGSIYATNQVATGTIPPACTAGTAGMICMNEGTNGTNVAGADLIVANSTTHELAVSTNGDANFGQLVRTMPPGTFQTGQTAAIPTSTLCAAAAGECNVAGMYHVHVAFWGSGTACSTPGPGGASFLLTWTDDNATVHSAVVVPMITQITATAMTLQSSAPTFPFQTALGSEGASGDLTIRSSGANPIQYATSYTPCTTGTGTYNFHAAVTRIR